MVGGDNEVDEELKYEYGLVSIGEANDRKYSGEGKEVKMRKEGLLWSIDLKSIKSLDLYHS